MAKKSITFAGNWTDFMRRGGLALAALGILMFVIKINTVIAFYFIFGGAASWLAGKALKARS
jgi:hypothetical protein